MVTPEHIKAGVVLHPYYAMLRVVPSFFGGVGRAGDVRRHRLLFRCRGWTSPR